jgi:uncharacterized protein DUF4904
MDNQRAAIVRVVESYINALGNKDLSGVPFAADFTFISPLLPGMVGKPQLTGEAAKEFLRGMFPLLKGVSIHHHIVEGEYCASLFDLDTIHGLIPVLDRFRVVNGQLKVANPFYDPTPILSAAAPKE